MYIKATMPGGKVQPKGRKPPTLPSPTSIKKLPRVSPLASQQPPPLNQGQQANAGCKTPSLLLTERYKDHTKQVHANMPHLAQSVRMIMGNLLEVAKNRQNPVNSLQKHLSPTPILSLTRVARIQTSQQSTPPGRGRPHIIANPSTITITSGRNETCQLTTTRGTTAGPPLHPPAPPPARSLHPLPPPLQQSPLTTAAGSAATPLVGDANVIIVTTKGVHNTDTTFGITPLCSPPWHALHLSQGTYITAFAEVSMCPLTNYCCLRG